MLSPKPLFGVKQDGFAVQRFAVPLGHPELPRYAAGQPPAPFQLFESRREVAPQGQKRKGLRHVRIGII